MANEVATLKEQTQTFGNLLEKYKGTFADLLPKALSFERMFRLGQLAMSRQPLLAQCSMSSLLSAMLKSAEMGLEPDGTMGALVPRRNKKTGLMEAQFQAMWQGLAELVRDANDVAILDTDIVHEFDKFIFIKGLEPKLEHTPAMRGDRGEIIGAWALIKFNNGGSDQEYMSKEDIEKVRETSSAKEYGPWATHWGEMARKTVFRRLVKRVRKSPRLSVALDAETQYESGGVIDMVALPEMPKEALPEPEKTATDKLAEKTRKPQSDKGTHRKEPDYIQTPETLNTLASPEPPQEAIAGEPEQDHSPQFQNQAVDADTVQELQIYCGKLGLKEEIQAVLYTEDKNRRTFESMTNAEAGKCLGAMLDEAAAKNLI